jgi:ATP-dependent Clp protease adaptor protein ClpS
MLYYGRMMKDDLNISFETPRGETPRGISVAGSHQEDDNQDIVIGLAIKTRPKAKKPAMYKVLMLNDDYTPMEFVVLVLKEFFRKTPDEATQIMLQVHQRGVGVCGVYTHEVAETKAMQVMALARKNQHPLQLQLEKE